MKKQKSAARQILLALVLGILLGSYLHYHAESRDWLISNLLTPAGDIFIHLIKMIVVPIVISTLVVGIAGVGDAKQLGRIGAKTIIYFEVITTVAIVLGITTANVFQPGSGIDMSQLAAVDISKYQNTTAEVQSHAHGLMGTILSLVPTNIVASMAKAICCRLSSSRCCSVWASLHCRRPIANRWSPFSVLSLKPCSK